MVEKLSFVMVAMLLRNGPTLPFVATPNRDDVGALVEGTNAVAHDADATSRNVTDNFMLNCIFDFEKEWSMMNLMNYEAACCISND